MKIIGKFRLRIEELSKTNGKNRESIKVLNELSMSELKYTSVGSRDG